MVAFISVESLTTLVGYWESSLYERGYLAYDDFSSLKLYQHFQKRDLFQKKMFST